MNKQCNTNIRSDYQMILDLVEPNSRVMDLGCGGGELLSLLINKKHCQGEGIEIDEKAVCECFRKGITVCHGDFAQELGDFPDKRFDYVILNESLQQVFQPQKAILEALRIGKKAIVGIPNFCHILSRLQIFFRGRVPVTKLLPYEWYDTPNLRFFSLKDFRSFCKTNNIKILNQKALGLNGPVNVIPNLFATIGIFLMEK